MITQGQLCKLFENSLPTLSKFLQKDVLATVLESLDIIFRKLA